MPRGRVTGDARCTGTVNGTLGFQAHQPCALFTCFAVHFTRRCRTWACKLGWSGGYGRTCVHRMCQIPRLSATVNKLIPGFNSLLRNESCPQLPVDESVPSPDAITDLRIATLVLSAELAASFNCCQQASADFVERPVDTSIARACNWCGSRTCNSQRLTDERQ